MALLATPPHPAVESAGRLLAAIPGLGLSPSDRQTVTFRARMLLESASGGSASAADTARHTRRLRALLRATGNAAAAALAADLAEQPPGGLADPGGHDVPGPVRGRPGG